MGIDYDPKQASKAWPEADYKATFYDCKDGISKTSGDEMETWTFTVYNDAGLTLTIKDYVTAKSAFKIKQLATALGKRAEFDAGKFHAEDHVGSNVIVALKIEEDDEYGDQNRIKTYRAPKLAGVPSTAGGVAASLKQRSRETVPATSPLSDTQQIADADIPF